MAQCKLFRFPNSADPISDFFLLQMDVIKSKYLIYHYVQQYWLGPDKEEEKEDREKKEEKKL